METWIHATLVWHLKIKFQMCNLWSSDSSRDLPVKIPAWVPTDIYTIILSIELFKTPIIGETT